jgi:hypothetical protein
MATSANTSHPTLAHTDNIAATWSDFFLLVGRVFLGWLFLASGYGKLNGIAGTTAYFTSLGMSPPELWAWFAAVGVGGDCDCAPLLDISSGTTGWPV